MPLNLAVDPLDRKVVEFPRDSARKHPLGKRQVEGG